MTGNRKRQTALFDSLHPYYYAVVPIVHFRIRPKETVGNYRGQIVHMHDMIDFGIGGRKRHGLS
jgi:hypothetical protein